MFCTRADCMFLPIVIFFIIISGVSAGFWTEASLRRKEKKLRVKCDSFSWRFWSDYFYANRFSLLFASDAITGRLLPIQVKPCWRFLVFLCGFFYFWSCLTFLSPCNSPALSPPMLTSLCSGAPDLQAWDCPHEHAERLQGPALPAQRDRGVELAGGPWLEFEVAAAGCADPRETGRMLGAGGEHCSEIFQTLLRTLLTWRSLSSWQFLFGQVEMEVSSTACLVP